jgi:all-trans-retinol dehydrogenase (NAD+)
MDNIHEVGVKPYNAAAEHQPPFSTTETLKFLVALSRKVIKYLLLSAWLYVKIIWEFVVPPEPKSIRGQIAVVTGGANGLGRALCHRLAKEGCTVIVVDVDAANIERTVADLKRQHQIKAKGYRV